MKLWTLGSILLLIGLLLIFPGCGREQQIQPVTDHPKLSANNLHMIAAGYRGFVEQKGRSPESLQELRPFVMFVNPNDFHLSARDNKPFVIYWGTPLGPIDLDNPMIIAHEELGADGKRHVFTMQSVVFMSDEEFAKANFPEQAAKETSTVDESENESSQSNDANGAETEVK